MLPTTFAQAVYCSACHRFVRQSGKQVPYVGGEPIVWIVCDRCSAREAKAKAELDRLEAMWGLRTCAAADCRIVFEPKTSTQIFHEDRCRKRTHRLLKAQRAAPVE